MCVKKSLRLRGCCDILPTAKINHAGQIPGMVPYIWFSTGADVCGRTTKKEKNHECNFNETVTGGRCSFWTSDKKMEP